MIIADPAKSFNASLGQGLRMGQGVQQMNRQNKLYDLYETHGQGIMQGDPNALAALAQVDPVQAFNLNSKVSANSRSSQIDEARLAQIKQETAFAAAKEAERLTAAERAAEAQETARVASSARAAYEQGPEAFSALVAQNAPALQEAGIDPNTVTYETWPMIEAGLIGAVEGLTAGVEAARGGAKPELPAEVREIEWRAEQLGLEPGTPEYRDFIRGDTGPDMDGVDSLRKEFGGLPAVKAFEKQSSAFGRIVKSAENPSPAGDLAMVFNFMKVLDPGSVVRESEFATAQNAAAWLQEQENLGVKVPLPVARAIRKMQTGEGLSDEQRQDFVQRAAALYRGAEEQHNFLREQYQSIAEQRGYPLDQSVIDFRYQGEYPTAPQPRTAAPTTMGPPAQGQTVDIDGGTYTIEQVE